MSVIVTRSTCIPESSGDEALTQFAALVKIGMKGPGVPAWAQRVGVVFPVKLYDCVQAEGAMIARVGGEELIVESEATHPLMVKILQALEQPETGVYRIEQQSVTLFLRGAGAQGILLQTCGVDMSQEAADRIVYTRVAGVSCGMIPQGTGDGRSYRLWCDYTMAAYLWDNLTTILGELNAGESRHR